MSQGTRRRNPGWNHVLSFFSSREEQAKSQDSWKHLVASGVGLWSGQVDRIVVSSRPDQQDGREVAGLLETSRRIRCRLLVGPSRLNGLLESTLSNSEMERSKVAGSRRMPGIGAFSFTMEKGRRHGPGNVPSGSRASSLVERRQAKPGNLG